MPKVQIIHFTGCPAGANGAYGWTDLHPYEREFAARLLAFTKNTRLNMNPSGFDKFLTMSWEEIAKELDYMAGTIPSSWEFVDVTFTLQQVSRACAQQITRTRFTPMDADIFGSYAMQSFRVTELEDVTFHINPEIAEKDESLALFIRDRQYGALDNYRTAIARGASQQDARGLLPMDTHCNLVVKFNLRQLVDMLRTRDESLRVQGEYGEVAHQMKIKVLQIWPWSEKFFEPKDQKAIKMIEEVAMALRTIEQVPIASFRGPTPNVGEMSTKLAKAADLLKK